MGRLAATWVKDRAMRTGDLFDARFASSIRALVSAHHGIYPTLPPQGIYFEALVERAFTQLGLNLVDVTPGSPNSPTFDLLVGNSRLTIKSETGRGTKEDLVTITKLCTTEREPWTSETLTSRVMAHLSRYDRMLMLRAVWRPGQILYQLLEIPLALLRLLGQAELVPAGRTSSAGRRRQSLGAFVGDVQGIAFRVFFDATDGKCSIRGLPVGRCRMLLQWEQPIPIHT